MPSSLSGLFANQSPRIVFASQQGAALNSNLSSGGGTDDTAALNAILATVPGLGSLHFIIDGPALISSPLVVYSNTILEFLPGAGLYLANGSNCTMLTNVMNGATNTTNNVQIINATLNCNADGQTSPYEQASKNQGDPFVWWSHGIWLGSITRLRIKDLTIINAIKFSLTLSNAYDVEIDGYSNRFDYTAPGNTDGIHIWGPSANLTGRNFTHNGGDDGIALLPVEFDVLSADGVSFGGSGYASAPTVVFSGGGSPAVPATGTAQMIYNPIIGFTMTNGGSGYTSPPTVTISGGNGSGAQAVARVANGVVTAVIIASPYTSSNPQPNGSGYTNPAGIAVAFSGGGGSGAAATAITTSGAVTGITVGFNYGYSSAPTATLVGGGEPE